ncbi:TPA: oxidoreductase, partial [Acinetobacter baumannii]|nr:oxidoreductase [Acinetobacter baumannii]HAV5004153.1 oxidoreductase [Acinetobacter baumannii]HAV5007762.1 oxidoreductase [Acinetobacter baumannii]
FIALSNFKPDLVIISNSDGFHFDVIKELKDFKGFVIAEKPLISPSDSCSLTKENLANISGFCMDLVERYSENTFFLKNFIFTENLRLVKCNFAWAKNRLGDYRSTTGVISEVIHPLDLINYICYPNDKLILKKIIGLRSDFSISGDNVTDSVSLIAELNQAKVIGYSSFVNLTRNRNIDFIFKDKDQNLIYVTLVYDNPTWDSDYLKIWKYDNDFNEVILHENKTFSSVDEQYKTILKLSKMVIDVLNFIKFKQMPETDFSDLNYALYLQDLLNKIDINIGEDVNYKYFKNTNLRFLFSSNDLEKLG